MPAMTRGLRRAGTALAALLPYTGAAAVTATPAAADPTFPTQLRNALTNKCLGINSGSRDNGALAMQWTCGGQYWSDQTWRFTKLLYPNWYQIRNVLTGMCLGIDRSSLANGALAIQATCSGTLNNQAWEEHALGNGHYEFRNFYSGKCLGISAGSPVNGALAMQWTCGHNPVSDQSWSYDPV